MENLAEIQDLGFCGFRVSGSGFRVEGLGLGLSGLGFTPAASPRGIGITKSRNPSSIRCLVWNRQTVNGLCGVSGNLLAPSSKFVQVDLCYYRSTGRICGQTSKPSRRFLRVSEN